MNVSTATIVANDVGSRAMADRDLAEIERQLDSGAWLSPSDVAALLDTTRTSVDRWLRHGIRQPDGSRWTPRHRATMGGHRSVHPEDVRTMLDRRRQVRGDDA